MAFDDRIAQIPDPADADLHPRLLIHGRGIHADASFTVLFQNGWHDIKLEVSLEPIDPGFWYIVGLFVKI